MNRQKEQEEAARRIEQQQEENRASTSDQFTASVSERRVGMKFKREENENDDVEWEEGPPPSG